MNRQRLVCLARDLVVLNAAAALWAARRSQDPTECAKAAAAAIDSRAAKELLEKLAAATREGQPSG